MSLPHTSSLRRVISSGAMLATGTLLILFGFGCGSSTNSSTATTTTTTTTGSTTSTWTGGGDGIWRRDANSIYGESYTFDPRCV